MHAANQLVFEKTVVQSEKEHAKQVGPVWGIGPNGEMNNMWKRTVQDGLWFVGGSFANCRTYSRYVALQIKAIEEGIAPQR